MKKRENIGDVFEIGTPNGLAYLQYTHDDPGVPTLGQLVRVLPGLYSSRPNISDLVGQAELYFIFYTLSSAARSRAAELIGNFPIPKWAEAFPVMRRTGGLARDGRVTSWLIGDGSKMGTLEQIRKLQRVQELTPEQRKLSIGCTLWPHPEMVKRLAEGWTPERDEEPAAKAISESKSTTFTPPSQPSEEIDHYLYFADRIKAERAARRLRDKEWNVEIRMGADNKNWLVLAKQPLTETTDMEHVREDLEMLADQLGGEYDGWGTSVNSMGNSTNHKIH